NGLLNYKELGISAKLAGKEKVGDREAFVLVFEPTTGSAVRQFVDAETYLPIQSMVKVNVPQLGMDVETTNELSDYRYVDGVKLPFKIHSSFRRQYLTIVLSKI